MCENQIKHNFHQSIAGGDISPFAFYSILFCKFLYFGTNKFPLVNVQRILAAKKPSGNAC